MTAVRAAEIRDVEEHAAVTSSGPRTLRVLSAVLEAVRSAGGYPDVLFRICEALTRTVRCDRATIYVWSSRRNAFFPVADHGSPEDIARAFVQRGFAAGAFPFEEALRNGRVVTGVRGSGPEFDELLEVARVHALAVLPLAFQHGAEGALACAMHQAPAFSPELVRILESVAPHIAVIIHNSRLEARAARLAERRARLAAWAAEVLGAADLNEMSARLCAASRTHFGAAHARLLLIEDGALVGRSIAGTSPAVPFRLPLDAESPVTDALRTGQVLVLNQFQETRYARSVRTIRPSAVLAVPLADAGGQVGVLTVVDTDDPFRFGPTDEEDARLIGAIATVALRKGMLVEALTRANAAKSEFLASVSHDLRTPLNVIMGYTQLLAEQAFGAVTTEQADSLARIHRTAANQLALINDLLDLARIEQGKLACVRQAVALAHLVPSLAEMMDALLRDRPVAFETDVPPDVVAWTDAERLRQILVNLLTNSAKFTVEGRVRLAARSHGPTVELAVSDTGPGMDPTLGARALEPFVHGNDLAAGSGLGLAIVSRLLRLLGGTLDLASTPGRGTTVTIRLPGA